MPSEVRHLVDGGQTYPVVRLTGVLDAGSAPFVRSAILGVLGSQPEAVVVDVRELSLGRPAAAEVLGQLAREATGWPFTRLVIVATGGHDDWRLPGLPIWPTPEAAFAALGRPHPGHFLSERMDPVVGAARRSRELVAEACARWELPELADPACIVLTEMVNNVVAHARTEMTVLLGLNHGRMSVAVRDRSATVPQFNGDPVPVTSYGGRGMLLIDAVASDWGSLVVPGGKVVWASLGNGDDDADRSARPGVVADEVAGNTRSTGMASGTRG